MSAWFELVRGGGTDGTLNGIGLPVPFNAV